MCVSLLSQGQTSIDMCSCYRALRISYVMPRPDRAYKKNSLVTPSLTLSNRVKCDIMLTNQRSTCKRTFLISPIIVHLPMYHSCSKRLTATWLASVLFTYCLQSQGHTFSYFRIFKVILKLFKTLIDQAAYLYKCRRIIGKNVLVKYQNTFSPFNPCFIMLVVCFIGQTVNTFNI